MRSLLPTFALIFAWGCYQSHPLLVDGPSDAGQLDAPIDAALPPIDVGPPPIDVGPPLIDADPRDAGPRDAGLRDAGPRDAGPRDAGPRDAGPRDAGPRDAGPRDAGPRDAGPPPFDAGPPRPALRLSPSTYWFVADAPQFDLANDSTFELWIRSHTLADANVCAKGDGIARDLIVGQRGGVITAGWQVAGTELLLRGPAVRLGEWTHVAMVRRATPAGLHRVELYVDGVLEEEADLPRLVDAFNDIDFRCGNASADVDEVRLWRVARAAADIAANRSRRVSGAIPALQSYWRLDERGQIVLDHTAMGRVGILGRFTTPDAADPTWILDGPF